MWYKIIILLALLNGCTWVPGDHYHRTNDRDIYYYDYSPYILDAGWECFDASGNRPDDWAFWARTDDGSGYGDLAYLYVRITSLIDSADVKEVKEYDNIDGYFSVERTYYYPECGDPIDVEYVIVDWDNNSESYTLYW